MIIVAGVHARVGTTLVQRLLCCDPECMIWGEPPQAFPPHRDGTQDYGLYVDPDISDERAGFFWNRVLGDPPPGLKMAQFADLRRGFRHVQCGIHHQIPCTDADLKDRSFPGYGEIPVDSAVSLIRDVYEKHADTPRWGFKVVGWRWTKELHETLLQAYPDLRIVFVVRDFWDTAKSWFRKSDDVGGEFSKNFKQFQRIWKENYDFAEGEGLPIIRYRSLQQDTLTFARSIGLNLRQEALIRALNSNPNPTHPLDKKSFAELERLALQEEQGF